MNINGNICRNCGENLLVKNRYRVVRLLGRGGFAKTFELDEQGTKKVLKVLDLSRFSHLKRKEIVVDLFQREAEVMSNLNHHGIPKVEPDGYFTIEYKNCEYPLYCLIMEKIDGLNLQQWLMSQNNQPITLAQAYTWLKQLVEILEQVHQKNYFHRDIKPANIMLRPDGQLVLIDFGAVKDLAETFLQQEDTLAGDTLIGSRGYAPSEQVMGKAKMQSDFFALGRTFVHLLTGIHPVDLEDQGTGKFVWRDKVRQISQSNFDLISVLRWQKLCDLLDNMMEESCKNRPRNTQIILQRLNDKGYISRHVVYAFSAAILFLFGIAGSYWYFTGVNGCKKIWIRSFAIGDNMSCGEEILMTNSIIPEKQNGVNAFAGGNYDIAVQSLTKAWQKQHDPETLIYLENALLEKQGFKAYTIAVVAPIGDNNNDSINSSKVILQGIAQAQNEFNQNHKDKKIGLKVLIASDKNSPEFANKIANDLGKQNEVLAVVGHFRSDTTLAAMDAYKHYKLLLVSSTATSEDLSTICQSDYPHCFFRVVDSNHLTAKALANYLKKANKHRAVVFYKQDSNYSVSLQKQMRTMFLELGEKVVAEIPFSDNLETMMNQVALNHADVIVLFPTTDGLTSDAAEQVIEYAKQSNYLIVGGDSLDTLKILRNLAENKAGSVMAIPWYPGNTLNQEFTLKAEKLWGTPVYWHTALTYDVTRVLLAALEKLPSPNRMNLEQAIAAPDFTASGATGKITFAKNGDRQQMIIHLVKVVRNSRTGNFEFVPTTTGLQ